MRKRSKKPKCNDETPMDISTQPQQQQQQLNCYEGERLIHLLKSLNREIESAKLSAKLSAGVLPEKLWIKQQFSIGVNDVTRTLERMKPISESGNTSPQPALGNCVKKGGSSVRLQAVIVAADCNPRWLTKHVPSLAFSRKVPLIFVRDKKGGSLRLGEILKMKTAIAIGVKVNHSGINKLVEEILMDNGNAAAVGMSEAE